MMRKVGILLCVLVLFAAGTSFAQVTTGTLAGKVTDNEGKPLPGVTVTISSDKLIGGPQVAVTDENGAFVFRLLPPGVYHIKTELSGFTPAELDAKVNLGRTTEAKIEMVLTEFAGEVQVVAEAPVVDTSQVDTGQVFDEQYLQNAAIGMGGRDYLSIIGQAAGVAGTANVSVYGSTGAENNYMVDGLTTTDPVTATFGTNFNYDAIQEVNFITGGFEAEYGQATGGVVNLVTKSGGNEFSGTLDIRYRDENFNESGDHYDPDLNISSVTDISATLGGPIVRDKVWFFVSAENVVSKSTPQPVLVDAQTRKYDGWNYIGKVTWQASDANRLIFKFSGDPADIDHANASGYVAPEASRFQTQDGTIVQAEINSVLSEQFLLTAQVGVNNQDLDSYPQSGDLDTPGYYNVDNGLSYNNYTNAQYSERNRTQARAHLSYFADDLWGSHEFKVGAEYHDMEFPYRSFTPGGYSVDVFFADEDGDGVDDWFDSDGDGLVDYVLYQDYPLETARDSIDSEGTMYTFFAQDAWRPFDNLTVKPGIRYESVSFDNDLDQTVADMSRWQPRFGVAWDIKNDGKHVVRLSLGRFMHPTALAIPSFASGRANGTLMYVGYDYWCSIGYCDPDFLASIFGDPFVQTDDNGFDHLWFPYTTYGTESAQTVDMMGVGQLRAPYADELILGYEEQIFENTSVEISYVAKKTRALMEDTCNNNSWIWGDGEAPDINDPSTWPDPGACEYYVLANIPGLRRDYRGYIVKFESRARDWFHILASYTWSKSQGNTGADVAQPYTARYDMYPAHFYNNYGFMGDHRRHRIKFNGYFLLPHDITIGFDGFWSSAPVLSVTESCSNIRRLSPDELAEAGFDPLVYDMCSDSGVYSSVYLEPRGSRRGKNAYQLDVQVTKGFQFGDVHMEAVLTVINLFSNERPAGWDTSYFSGDPWGTTVAWQQPRRYELGLRFEF
jgi:hypothetical protein